MVTILQRRFPDLEILTLADFPGAPEPEETGETYAENAAIKVRSAAEFTGQWSLADDAGLEIDALGGEPGVFSKRFEGENTPFSEKMSRILQRMKDAESRAARFQCYVALGVPGKDPVLFNATCEGVIADEPTGQNGFGYDPIFYLPELGKCMAELTADEKHAISHRGKVLAKVADWLAR